MRSITIKYSKEELVKNIKKYEKMKKKYNKNEELLKNNKIYFEFFEKKELTIIENNKDISYIKEQIKKINTTDYPFNPECDCCLKQPWKIQLNDLEERLKELEKKNCKIQNNVKNKKEELNINLEGIKKNILKYDEWFKSYKELKKNNKEYTEQLNLFEIKENLETKYNEKNIETNKINKKLKDIEDELLKINVKLEYKSWIDRKNTNLKDKTNYELYINKIVKEWTKMQEYNNYLEIQIKNNEENNKNKKLLEYWNMVLNLKPEWNVIKIKNNEIKSKRKYYQNITNKYLNLNKLYEIYLDECNKIKNYKNINYILETNLEGVKILSEMFNNYRIWLYKEKLFPLVLSKINLIIENMSKDNELLKLDIVWYKDTFNWFIIHNDNKIVFNKASGYQKFIIDLSMRITLSSIGVSSLKCNQLFIDEGFSTCDQDHLNKIPLFLNSLLNIYNSVLVVSHIQEIKNCTTSSYNIQRDNNLSLIEYGNNKNKNLNDMIKKIKTNNNLF